MRQINISSKKRQEFLDITKGIREAVQSDIQGQNGVLIVYCPHTTAGITINESADPSVATDLLTQLAKLVPENANYSHMEGNSDAHIKSSLIGCSEKVLVENGRLALGTWQGIFFAEFDGPRSRKAYLQFFSASR